MLVLILFQNSFSLWGHHLPGKLNFITDKLSYSNDLSFSEMISKIIYSCKTNNFNPPLPIFFQKLPYQLELWIGLTLQSLMLGQQLLRELPELRLQPGEDRQISMGNLTSRI